MTKASAAILVGYLLLTSTALAAEVTLVWDPVEYEFLAGYKLYYGNDAGPPFNGDFFAEGASPVVILASSLEDPQNPRITLRGIPSCIHVFFVVTAFGTNGLESDFSNMIEATIVDRPQNVVVGPGPARGSLNITWDELRPDDRGTLASYRIHYDPNPAATLPDAGVAADLSMAADGGPGDGGISDGSLKNPPIPPPRSGESYLGSGAREGPSPLTIDAKDHVFTLSGLTPGASYYAAVEAICPDQEMKISAEASGVAADQDGQGPDLYRSPVDAGCCSVSAPDPDLGLSSLLGALALLLLTRRCRRPGSAERLGRSASSP